MKKSLIKKVAKIYSAVGVYNMLGCGGGSDQFTEDEHEYFSDQVNEVAGRIAKGLPDKVFNLGSLDDIINYVKSLQDEKA